MKVSNSIAIIKNIKNMVYLYIWIVLQLLGVGLVLGKHGQPREDYNFWSFFIACLIEWWLLYKAGLFDILTK